MDSIVRSRPESDLTVFEVNGVVTSQAVLRQIVSFLTTAPTPLALWLLSPGALSRIACDEFHSVVRSALPYLEARRGGRTAVVGRTDVDFGMSRVLQSVAEVTPIPFEIHVFRDEAEARAWLRGLPASDASVSISRR